MIYLQDTDFTLHLGDVLSVLREMPSESVDCVITSPPYWGLRDYGTGAWAGGDEGCDHPHPKAGDVERNLASSTLAGTGQSHANNGARETCHKCGATRQDAQLGLEPTPEQYVERMTEVFREVRRVCASHATVWCNMGDSFSDKQLVGVPWRLAFALQADGWYLRSDIVWSKPNPMPESVTDRPTKAHEYVFLLTKSPRYFFDQEAVREQFESRPQQRLTANVDMPLGPARVAAGVQQGNPQGGTHVSRFAVVNCGCEEAGCGSNFHEDGCGCACHVEERWNGIGGGTHDARATRYSSAGNEARTLKVGTGRNIRSVWEIATQPYPEAHFATFPEELVRRCLLAGCAEGGVVLDPFCGSGTTALVARKHGRRAVGIELNAEYCELIVKRTQQLSLLSELA